MNETTKATVTKENFKELMICEKQAILFEQNEMIIKQNQEIIEELKQNKKREKEIDIDICEGFAQVLNHLGSHLCGLYNDKILKNKAIRVIGMFGSAFDNKARKIKDEYNLLDNYYPTMEEMIEVLNGQKENTKENTEEILKGLESLLDILGK